MSVPSGDIEGVVALDALVALEDRWATAVERRDVAAAGEILAEDFILTSEGGVSEAMPRDDWLGALPKIETSSLICEVLQARVFDETAVVRARLRWEARMQDRDLTGDYIVADVFRKANDRWRATWRISTRLSDG
jgi:hypothetical protein